MRDALTSAREVAKALQDDGVSVNVDRLAEAFRVPDPDARRSRVYTLLEASLPRRTQPVRKAYPQLQQAAMRPGDLQEAFAEGRVSVGREGQLLVFPRRYPQAVGSLRDLPETEEIEVEHRAQDAVDRFDEEVGLPALDALTRATSNGRG